MPRLHYLGTGGSTPMPDRGLSCTVLDLDGCYIMVDCGEGSTRQFLQSNLKWNKPLTILLTHLHLDHTLGLFGLLQTMDIQGRDKPVEIYGTVGTKKFARNINGLLHKLSFDVNVHELEAGDGFLNFHNNEITFTVNTYATKHRTTSLAYKIQLKDKEGVLDIDRCIKLGVPDNSPLLGSLKKGVDVFVDVGEDDTRLVRSRDVVGEPTKGLVFGFSGDTRAFPKLGKFFNGVDYLTYESTFTSDEIAHAIEKKHSTAGEAGHLAKNAKVKTLILNHYGARHGDPQQYNDEASKFHHNVITPKDLDVIEV